MARVDDILAVSHVHINSGNLVEAERVLRAGLRQFPNHPLINQNMAAALFNFSRPQEASVFAQRTAQLNPKDRKVWLLLAKCLVREGKAQASIDAAQKCIVLSEGVRDVYVADAYNTMSVAQQGIFRSEDALHSSRTALSIVPDDPRYQATYSASLADHAQPDEAYVLVRAASMQHAKHRELSVAAVNAAMYSGNATPMEKHALSVRAGELLVQPALRTPLGGTMPSFRPTNERIRLGLVSYDFRQHSCSYFIRPLLEHLPAEGCEIHVFSLLEKGDNVTEAFRKSLKPPHVFHDVGKLQPRLIAERVRAAGIDVLLDLGGLTAGSGIEVLTFRPVRVQGTYLGYAGTTGMPGVDFRIVDSWTDPVAQGENNPQRWHSETLVRMDRCFVCYHAPSGPPSDVASKRSGLRAAHLAGGGGITFGSFNAPMKISLACLKLWALALQAAPGSRLLLKGTSLGGIEAPRFIRERMAEFGIAPDRVECIGRTKTHEEHLSVYEQIDIALDTFPYHGTTTTCEALLCGVPVVTCLGPSHASRVGASLLHAVGLEELCANSAEEFASIAGRLAADRTRLVREHATLRERTLASALCDGASHAKSFVTSLRTMMAAVAEGRG